MNCQEVTLKFHQHCYMNPKYVFGNIDKQKNLRIYGTSLKPKCRMTSSSGWFVPVSIVLSNEICPELG